MSNTKMTLRQMAYARSIAREFAVAYLGDNASCFDLDSIVTDLVAANTVGFSDFYQEMDFETQLRPLLERHEFDEQGMTDAAMEKALKNSQTGWVAMVRRPGGDVDMMNLAKGVEGTTAETIEKTLRDFVNFPEGTQINIFPLVG